tara:strand:+ start:1742 stop:1981 length:240 start_codon:yes stop_codon:yes gene_type:complete
MATLEYRGKQKKALSNAKFVTRKAKLRMINTLNKLGMMETELLACTLAHLLRLKKEMDLKTTKFIQSKPVVKFKGEPPF